MKKQAYINSLKKELEEEKSLNGLSKRAVFLEATIKVEENEIRKKDNSNEAKAYIKGLKKELEEEKKQNGLSKRAVFLDATIKFEESKLKRA